MSAMNEELHAFDDLDRGSGFDDLSFDDPGSHEPLAPETFVPVEPPADVDDLPNIGDVPGEVVAGSPESELAFWHQQESPDTCAVAAQEFVLESLTGDDVDEATLVREATENGWYTPGGGTSMAHMDSLLEAHGVPTATHFAKDLGDISAALNEGNRVLVPLDADETWSPGMNYTADELIGDTIAGKDANHVVEVTGIVDTSEGQMVALNDPGHPDGRGALIPAGEFCGAWDDADRYMVSAGPAADDSIEALPTDVFGLGTAIAAGQTEGGDSVSWSTSYSDHFNDRTGEQVDPV